MAVNGFVKPELASNKAHEETVSKEMTALTTARCCKQWKNAHSWVCIFVRIKMVLALMIVELIYRFFLHVPTVTDGVI